MALGMVLLMLLGGVGMCAIIVEGEIFVPVKNFLKKFMPEFFMKMLNCHQCCGFWSGLLLSLFFIHPWHETSVLNNFYNFGLNFASACAVSLLSVFWATIMVFIESKTTING
jgi:ammonia channel protein AmtB